MIVVAPSILAADPARLGEEARRAEKAGADWLHVDIMDGHFVPNLTFGPGVVAGLKRRLRLPLDVHLMMDNPEALLTPFLKAGADVLTVHVELGRKVEGLLWKIRSLGAKAGLAINPPTAVEQVKPYLKLIDLLLVMTVNPGYGGQPFMPETLPKIIQAARWRAEAGLGFRIEVDGGINEKTLPECVRAGADTIVSGTSLFGSRSLPRAIRRFRKLAAEAAAQLARPGAASAAAGARRTD